LRLFSVRQSQIRQSHSTSRTAFIASSVSKTLVRLLPSWQLIRSSVQVNTLDNRAKSAGALEGTILWLHGLATLTRGETNTTNLELVFEKVSSYSSAQLQINIKERLFLPRVVSLRLLDCVMSVVVGNDGKVTYSCTCRQLASLLAFWDFWCIYPCLKAARKCVHEC